MVGRKLSDVGVHADPARFVALLGKLEPQAVDELAALLTPERLALLRGGTRWLDSELSNMSRELAPSAAAERTNTASRGPKVPLEAFPQRARAWLDPREHPPAALAELESRTAERVRPLNAALVEWAARFRVLSPFVLKVAAYTLREWAMWEVRVGRRSKQRELMVPVECYSTGATDALESRAWGREAGTTPCALPKRERAQLGSGLVATLRRRTDAELTAFIRWQVHGWNLPRVAGVLRENQPHPPTAHGVNKQVRAIALELGIAPREASRGRPRRSA